MITHLKKKKKEGKWKPWNSIEKEIKFHFYKWNMLDLPCLHPDKQIHTIHIEDNYSLWSVWSSFFVFKTKKKIRKTFQQKILKKKKNLMAKLEFVVASGAFCLSIIGRSSASITIYHIRSGISHSILFTLFQFLF